MTTMATFCDENNQWIYAWKSLMLAHFLPTAVTFIFTDCALDLHCTQIIKLK